MRVPIALIAWGALALLAPAASDGAQERVRLVMFSGERLEGRVYDLGDQYLELHRSLGSTRIPKSLVESWSLSVDPGVGAGDAGLLLVLGGGHEIGGDVRFDANSLEWVVDLAAGQARYPEKQVIRTIPPSGVTSDGLFTPRVGFEKRIADAILGVRSNDAIRRESGSQLIDAAGYFALRAVLASLEKDGANEILDRLSLEEQFRVVVPAGIEDNLPNLLTDLLTGRAESRVQVLREALVESGPDIYPLLGLVLLDKTQPGMVRSFAIEVLGRMHCVRELIGAYKVAEGQAQFAIAIALGDNGVYLGVPTLIEALELPVGTTPSTSSVTAQEIAARRLREYSGENFGYSGSGTESERVTAIQRWHKWWEDNRRTVEESIRENLAEGEESPRRRRAADLWRQGMLARARGQLESAMQFFERAHAEDPTSAAPLISLGLLAYTYRQDPQAGIDYFRQALSRAPSTGEETLIRLCYFHLGRIYQRGRDYDMAQKSLRKAVEVDPSFTGAWFELGMVQYQQALLIGGDDFNRRREALRQSRDTFAAGIEALESYRQNQSMLDLNSLPFDEELPFSTRDHNRSLRDIREQLLSEIGKFHFQMAVISVALDDSSLAQEHLRKAKECPKPPPGLEELERVVNSITDRP